jgi:NADPH2:quinone reductase
MRALVSRVAGGANSLTLEHVAVPTITDGQLLIRVHACSANYPDILIIQDRYQVRPPRPFSPGSEIAGVVEQVGGKSAFQPGQRVMASCSYGGMAEYIALDEADCVAMPEEMPYRDAACFLMTYGTAYHACAQRAQLKRGDTFLVLGAAGGVGLAAVELGRNMGANVIAAVSSDEKAAIAIERGASRAVVYPPGPLDVEQQRVLSRTFKEACGDGGAHVIYDAVGGPYSESALRAISWEGRFLVVGFPAGIASIPLNLPLLKSCQIVGVFYGAWRRREPQLASANIHQLLRFYAQGTLRPSISHILSFERAAEALMLLESRQAKGKIVVDWGSASSDLS